MINKDSKNLRVGLEWESQLIKYKCMKYYNQKLEKQCHKEFLQKLHTVFHK